jgi:hypothetical protein
MVKQISQEVVTWTLHFTIIQLAKKLIDFSIRSCYCYETGLLKIIQNIFIML